MIAPQFVFGSPLICSHRPHRCPLTCCCATPPPGCHTNGRNRDRPIRFGTEPKRRAADAPRNGRGRGVSFYFILFEGAGFREPRFKGGGLPLVVVGPCGGSVHFVFFGGGVGICSFGSNPVGASDGNGEEVEWGGRPVWDRIPD